MRGQASEAVRTVEIGREGLRLVGTAHEVNRVLQACQNAMSWIELNKIDINSRMTVVVLPAQDDED